MALDMVLVDSNLDSPGCIDPIACNYDPAADVDDGSCDYGETACPEPCNVIFGCTDASACNYNTFATCDDESCLVVTDGCPDGCDSVFGCTDATSCNFNPDANCDDGSCDSWLQNCPEPCNVILGCTNYLSCNFNPEANCDDGSCDYGGNQGCEDPCNAILGCTDPVACNFNPDATCDSSGLCNYGVTGCATPCETTALGCTDPIACNFDPEAICEIGNCYYGIEICPDPCNDIPGCTNEAACNFEPEANCDDASCLFGDACDSCGCTDPMACNYNPDATCDNGTCDWGGVIGCPDPCNAIIGCTDPMACNFNISANCDNGNCLLPNDQCLDPCNCLPGCADPIAINYDPTAESDGGLCHYLLSCNDVFFDSGGPNEPYQNSETTLYTICPQNEDGIVIVDFSAFEIQVTESGLCFDRMTIYDGPDFTYPIISTPTNTEYWCWENSIGTDLADYGPIIPNNEFGCLSFYFESYQGNPLDGWEASITCESYDLTGISFWDQNENGIYDGGEILLDNQAMSLDPLGITSYSDVFGLSKFILAENENYTLSINPDPIWQVNGPSSVSFQTNSESTDTSIYFPLIPVANFTTYDLDITSGITRCFWDVNYWLTYTNSGTTISNGWLNLIPSELTSFQSADPAADSIAADGTLYWFFENLAPTQSHQIKLGFTMPEVDAIGELIIFEANIDSWDNSGAKKKILSSELLCAYDPNDKQVEPFGYGDENYTLFEDVLDYTIRFQNTGNDTAFNIVVRDTLDANLDLSSFSVIASSHQMNTLIREDSRIVEFTFDNILLVDSITNEPDSHGFIKYAIKGKEELNENTEIENTAGIYFDFNPPIVTNTVSNNMVSVLPVFGHLEINNDDFDFGAVQPGSTSLQYLFIENSGGDFDLTVFEIDVLDDQGIFSIDQSPFILKPGESKAIPISFIPQEGIEYQGAIRIRGEGNQFNISLRGNGDINAGSQQIDLAQKLTISPNPSIGVFYLEWIENSEQRINYVVYDALGNSVLASQINSGINKLDLSGFSAGLYYFTMETKDGNVVRKIVVD